MKAKVEVGFVVKEINGAGFEFDRGTFDDEEEARYMAHFCHRATITKVTLVKPVNGGCNIFCEELHNVLCVA